MANAVNQSKNDDVIEIDLQELLGLLLHWLWLIAGCGIIAAMVGFLISFLLITPKYESTTRVYILNSESSKNLTYSDTQLANTLTKDYEELITSRTVLEKVIELLEIDESCAGLKGRITIKNRQDTRIIDITVKDESPALAQQIANTIRDISAERIESVMSIEAVNLVDEANLPTSPSEPSVAKWTAVGFLVGFILCAAVVIIQFLLDDTIKSSEDIENYLGLSTLALIPDANMEEKKKKTGKQSTGGGGGQREQHRTHHEHAYSTKARRNGTEDNGSLEEVDIDS